MEPRERLDAIVRRWPIVAAAVFVGLVLAVGVSSLTPTTYQAQTRLFVSAGADTPKADGKPTLSVPLAGTRVRSYPALATSPDVLGPVAERFGLTATGLAGRVQAVSPPGTQLIDVVVNDRTAPGAADLANTVAGGLIRELERLETQPGAGVPLVRVRTVVPAMPPSAPLWPSLTVHLTTGLVGGLLAGAGAALVIERRVARQ